jgi:arylsulfatase A-like enzyme
MAIARALFLLIVLAPLAFAAGPPTIVLISIDTLRADHLPMYGYAQSTAPFLASMAERGTVFENVWAPMPSTTPSHGSMLTGQYPSGHGSLALTVPLKRDVETIAEALQKSGYYTIGAVAVSHIGRVSNFDQGFTDFADTGGARTRDGKSVNAEVLRMVAASRRSNDREAVVSLRPLLRLPRPVWMVAWSDRGSCEGSSGPEDRPLRRFDSTCR